MNLRSLMVISFATAITLAGCGTNAKETSTPSHAETEHGHAHQLKNGDIQEETESAEVLPEFLKDRPEQMRTVYKAAALNEEVLSSVPCYCGCGDSAGHKSSLNCFVAEIKDNGAVLWDDHGTRCNVCIEIAAESIAQFKDGKSLKEIRTYIDDKYKEGYAKPTPTPMPKA